MEGCIWDSFKRPLQGKVHLGRENTFGLAEGRRFLAGQGYEHSLKAGVTVAAAGQHHRSWAFLREGACCNEGWYIAGAQTNMTQKEASIDYG